MTDAVILLSITDYLDAQTFFDWFVNNANYWFVFLFMAIESSFIPFPSEVVVPPAAYLAMTRGDMNVFGVVLAATLGAIVGAAVNYWLAVWLGRPIVYRFADSRLGHACLIDRPKVEKAEAYFDRHGNVSTFIGRLIPAVRQLISIPAGLARMSFGKFVIFTGLGALLWNMILAALGYWLSLSVTIDKLYEMVEKYNGYLTVGGLVLLGLIVLYLLWNAFFKYRNKNAGAV